MRALAFFFACYFALLGGWFCQEVEPDAAATSVTVIKAAPSGGRTSHGEADWCSPLCQCHCSAGFALPTTLLVALTGKTIPAFLASRFTSLAASTLLNREGKNPWQPPRA